MRVRTGWMGWIVAAALACVAPLSAAQVGFRCEEVEIAAEEGVALAGTLRLPDAQGPVPAVVLITGSGDHVRDQVISGAPMFRWLADHLAARGIATLSIDTRGAGESTGVGYPEQNTTGRVSDVQKCVEFLRMRPEIDPERLGLLGHSEGSMIAPRVCAQDPAISFCVLLSAPARPGREIFITQQMRGLRDAPQEKRDALRTALERMIDASMNEPTPESMQAAATDVLVAFGRDRASITPDDCAGIIQTHSAGWYLEYLSSDTEQWLRKHKVPTLAVYGALDRQTPPGLDAPRLAAALAEAGNADHAIRVLPGEGHFFLISPGMDPGQHRYGTARLSPALLEEVSGWILEQTTAP